jgi:hypothetical protein
MGLYLLYVSLRNLLPIRIPLTRLADQQLPARILGVRLVTNVWASKRIRVSSVCPLFKTLTI